MIIRDQARAVGEGEGEPGAPLRAARRLSDAWVQAAPLLTHYYGAESPLVRLAIGGRVIQAPLSIFVWEIINDIY